MQRTFSKEKVVWKACAPPWPAALAGTEQSAGKNSI